jgi:hypothetical protein
VAGRTVFKEQDLLNVLARTPARLVLPAVLLAAAAVASAQQPAEPSQQPREHVVRRGDTLWDLARTYLGDPFKWPSIFEANRTVVENPHWIYPAERLMIPPLQQQQQPPPQQQQGRVLPQDLQQDPVGYPRQPAVEPLPEQARPAPATVVATVDTRRSLMTAGQYLSMPWIAPPHEAAPVARVTRKADPAAEASRLAESLLPNDRVHVDLAGITVAVGDTLLVARGGRQVGEWGRIMEPLGLLRVETVAGDEAVARLVAQYGGALVGDAVMRPAPVPDLPAGELAEVTAGPEGMLLEFLGREPLYGTTDLAFISLGRADGVGIGDEFAVYVPLDARLPPERVGVVRVVKVGERTSTVRVLSVTGAALGDGLPIRLIRKMP